MSELVETAAATPPVNHSKLDERIARARQGFLSGVLDDATAKAAIADAERELAALPAPVSTGAVTAGDALVDVHELWPHMTDDERRDLVRMTVDAVAVDLACGEVRGMLPKEHFAPLFHVMADGDGGIRVADWPSHEIVRNWRPRSDSNRRSPP